MSYWSVRAKCGHVRKSKYIIKTFFVKAESKKEAADHVRWTGRVKHHDKKAIIEVSEINEETYFEGIKANSTDPYFNVSNIQDQRRQCVGIDFETFYEEEKVEYKKKISPKRYMIENLRYKEWEKGRNYIDYEQNDDGLFS